MMSVIPIILTSIAMVLRVAGSILTYWKALLLLALILSPYGPHILLPNGHGYNSCTYLGSRGFIRAHIPGPCPAVALLDAREGR